MVTDMKKISKNKFVSLCLSALIFAFSAAWGQVLTDPTRPPGSFEGMATGSGVMPYAPVKGLQSVFLFAGHCAAIIDGKTVLLGARHGGERLVEVSEHGVTLQGGHGRRELSLFPTVAIRTSSVKPAQKNTIKCHFEPGKHSVNPAKQSGPKEKK